MLIPDTIKFAYVSRTEIQIHENSITAAQRPSDMVDFSLPSTSRPEEEEHVLVLEFIDNLKGKRSANIGHASSLDEVKYRTDEFAQFFLYNSANYFVLRCEKACGEKK